MSHWAQLNLQAPCSCHSSCSDVLFPTAVVEYNIQTNQAELTTLWLGGGSGSGESILWNADTNFWVSGLDLWNWNCSQLACQLMRRSYLLCNWESLVLHCSHLLLCSSVLWLWGDNSAHSWLLLTGMSVYLGMVYFICDLVILLGNHLVWLTCTTSAVINFSLHWLSQGD